MKAELQIWRDRWLRCSTTITDTLHGTLTLCDHQLFPNVHHLLQLGCVLPVTSCGAERSFSAFRRVKTVFRSCMGEEWLSSLLHIHYDVQIMINSRTVVEEFIRKQLRNVSSLLFITKTSNSKLFLKSFCRNFMTILTCIYV